MSYQQHRVCYQLLSYSCLNRIFYFRKIYGISNEQVYPYWNKIPMILKNSWFIIIIFNTSSITLCTYLKMLEFVILGSLGLLKWPHHFKIAVHKREKLILPRFYRSGSAVLFHFPLRNLDIDRFRQAYEGREWHTRYYVQDDSGERVSMEGLWWLNGKELCLIEVGGCFTMYRYRVTNPPVNLQHKYIEWTIS